eukprot:1370831-Ditylum_brightwellii.AAC.1
MLDHLNHVHLYLGATTLADLVDNDGNFLHSWALAGFDHQCPITLWPNQHKPAKCSWQIWRRFLRSQFFNKLPKNSCLVTNWKLDSPLELWTVTTPLVHRNAYLDKEENVMYVSHTNGCYTRFEKDDSTLCTYYPTGHQVLSPPSAAVFAPIQRTHTGVLNTNLMDPPDTQGQPSCSSDTFDTFLENLPPAMLLLLGNLPKQEIDLDMW